MARKSPTEFVEFEPDSVRYVFDEHVVAQLLGDARIQLAPNGLPLVSAGQALNSATYWLRIGQVYSDLPAPVTMRKALKQIMDHAKALRSLLRVVDDDGLDGTGSNPRVVAGIAYLLVHEMQGAMDDRFIELAERSAEGRKYPEIFGARAPEPALLVLTELLNVVITAGQRNLGDDAPPTRAIKNPSPLMGFAKTASNVYLRLTGKTRLSVSRDSDTKEVGGPLIRFLLACCAQVGEQVRPETLASWVRKWRDEQTLATQAKE